MNRIKYFFIALSVFCLSNIHASFVSLYAPEHIQACNGYLKYHSAEQISEYLQYVENINAKDATDNTLLHKNICSNNIDLIRLLLQAGALLTIEDKLGQTPLYKLILLAENEEEAIEILNICMQYKNLNIIANDEGKTLIHAAVMNKKNKILDFLCNYYVEHLEERGMAYINAFDNYGYTAINECITHNNYAGLTILLNHEADPNKTQYSFTPLFEAIRQKNTKAVRILLNDPRTEYKKRKKLGYSNLTPLDYARSIDGKEKIIKLLEKKTTKK
jgi:ankyrin repeat protein